VSLEFFLYSRNECELCVELEKELAEFLQGIDYKCHVIDIDSDPELQHRYMARIPVLEAGNELISEYKLNRDKLKQYIKKH